MRGASASEAEVLVSHPGGKICRAASSPETSCGLISVRLSLSIEAKVSFSVRSLISYSCQSAKSGLLRHFASALSSLFGADLQHRVCGLRAGLLVCEVYTVVDITVGQPYELCGQGLPLLLQLKFSPPANCLAAFSPTRMRFCIHQPAKVPGCNPSLCRHRQRYGCHSCCDQPSREDERQPA